MIDICHMLFAETVRLGHGGADMIAVLRALAARTERPLSTAGGR